MDQHPFEIEVLGPAVTPRMKQRRRPPGLRVDPGQVRTLAQVAAVAGQCEVVRTVRATVLPGHNVLHMMDQLAMFLMQPAILATLASASPDEVPCRRIHLLLNRRIQVQPGFQFEDRNEIRRVDQRLILGTLVGAKSALIGPLRKRVDSFLNRRGDLEVGHSTSGLSVETAAQGIQKTIQASRNTHSLKLARNAGRAMGHTIVRNLLAGPCHHTVNSTAAPDSHPIRFAAEPWPTETST